MKESKSELPFTKAIKKFRSKKLLLALLVMSFIGTEAIAQFEKRINAGHTGSNNVSYNQLSFEPDNGNGYSYTGDSRLTNGHSNNTMTGIFDQTKYSKKPFQYTFPNLNQGDYVITLYFAEPYHGTALFGSSDTTRQFNIDINGNRVATDLCVYCLVGPNAVYQFSYNQQIAQGQAITLSFSKGSGNDPIINGIEIVQQTSGGGDTTPPTTPTLSALGKTTNSVDLAWSGATDDVGITGYQLFQNGSLNTTLGNVSSHTITGLSPSTNYQFSIRALDAAGNVSAESNTLSVTTDAAADTTPPTSPSLTSTGKSTNSVDLSWSGATDNVGITGYQLFQDGSLNTTLGNVSSHTVTGLSPSTSYQFNIRALDAAGNASTDSNTLSVTTDAAADTTPPAAPTNLTTSVSGSSVDLSWTAPGDSDLEGHHIFQDGTQITSTLISGSTYSVTSLSDGTYTFTVRANDTSGNQSAQSNDATATINTSGGGSNVWSSSGNDISYTTGNVGVQTGAQTGFALAVGGKIISEEVNVQLQGDWPDYVFTTWYDLPSLKEVQEHIDEKGHLINVPSAIEVAENGIEIGEMNRLLVEKLEELTLYILEQEKRIQNLEIQIQKKK